MASPHPFSPDVLPDLLGRARELLVVLSPAGRIDYANGGWQQALGYEPDQLIGRQVIDLVDPRWHQRWQDWLDGFLQQPVETEMAMVLQGKHGEQIRVAGHMQPILRGGKLQAIQGIWRDATAQTRHDQQLQAQYIATRAMAEGESLSEATGQILKGLCGTFNWREGAFWVVDPETNQLRCAECWIDPDSGAQQFEEATRAITFPMGGGLVGRIWQRPEPTWLPNILNDANFWRREAAVASGLISAFCFPVIDRGRVIGIFEFFSGSIEAPDDELLAVLGTIGRQIGRFFERIEAQAELAEALVKAQAAARAKASFLANMSHELRTPLNSIIGFSKVLRDGTVGPLNDKQQQFLETINRNGSYLLELIDGILDLSKFEAGQLTVRPAAVDLTIVVYELLASLVLQAEQKQLRIHVTGLENLPLVAVDPIRVRQIITNLLVNAIKFTSPGGQISLDFHREDARVGIAVADTGIGVATEDQARIFEPFVQIDSSLSRQQKGTGLGLPLARHLVELHGGELKLESETGKGSTFRFTLPVFVR